MKGRITVKRNVAVTLFIVLLVTLLTPVPGFAQYDTELEKAISTAKSVLDVPKAYDNFTYNMYRQNDRTVFDLNWSDSKNRLGSINATIDSTGKIINYNSYKITNGQNQRRLPVFSKSDALTIADNFIRRVAPEIFTKIKFMEDNSPANINDTSYQFNYIREEKGIPFPENGIHVSVDRITGEVQSFNCNWYDEIQFPDPEGLIALDKAQTQYENKLGLKLMFRMDYEPKEPKPYLVYASVYNNMFIDAKSGDVVRVDNYYGYNYYNYDRKQTIGMGGGLHSYAGDAPQVLTPKEQEAVENAAGLMDQSKAEKMARNTLNIDPTLKLTDASLFNNWQNRDEFTWNLNFAGEVADNGNYMGFSVSLDAKTGEIISFYRAIPVDPKAAVKYSQEQSLKLAQDFIKSLQPKKYMEVEYTDWNQPVVQPMKGEEQPRQYYFNFTRKVNDAYFLDNGFNITVDTTNGTIINYNINWYKKELPSIGQVIAPQQAHKILFDTIGLQVQYISSYPPEVMRKIVPVPDSEAQRDIKLVYAVNPEKPANIDPYTGKLLNFDGKPFDSGDVAQYNDIKGSYAENQIKVLTEYGISLPGKSLNPNQKITQRDFLYLLYKSLEPQFAIGSEGSAPDDDSLYNFLTDAGVVREGERSPAAPVSRQDAVKFIIRAMHYDKVAEINKGIYTLPFKDAKSIKPDLLGYVALAYGLNIVNGNQGYFNPTGNVTRAQAFVMIYNFLNIQ